MWRRGRSFVGLFSIVALGLAAVTGAGISSAVAAGSGGMPLELRLEGASGQMRRASPKVGRSAVFVYEGREAMDENVAFKEELLAYMLAHPAASIDVAAIADVRGLNFFPINEFVRLAVQQASVRTSTEVLLDWKGRWGDTFGCPRGVSTVIVIGRDGRELFRHSGRLSDEQRLSVLQMIDGVAAP